MNERVAKLEGNHKSITSTFSRPIRPSDVFSYFHTNYHKSKLSSGHAGREENWKREGEEAMKKKFAKSIPYFPTSVDYVR